MAKIIYFGTEGNGRAGHYPTLWVSTNTLPSKNAKYGLNVTTRRGSITSTRIPVVT